MCAVLPNLPLHMPCCVVVLSLSLTLLIMMVALSTFLQHMKPIRHSKLEYRIVRVAIALLLVSVQLELGMFKFEPGPPCSYIWYKL